MSENPKYRPQIPEIGDSTEQKSKREELVGQRIQSENSIETEIHDNKESIREKKITPKDVKVQSTKINPTSLSSGQQSDFGQSGNQTHTGDGTGSSSRKLGDVGQSSDQIQTVNPTQSSYADSAELKEWKLKQKQISEQQQKLQDKEQAEANFKEKRDKELKDELQKIKRTAEEQQPSESHSENQEENLFRGQGQ